jgi:predicted SAM-dependent methyltransferase
MTDIARRLIRSFLFKLGYEIRRRSLDSNISLSPSDANERFSELTLLEMSDIIEKQINYSGDRMVFRKLYSLEKDINKGLIFRFKTSNENLETIKELSNKYDLRVRNSLLGNALESLEGFGKINYGCGSNILKGWLNVDIYDSTGETNNYLRVNLIDRHPFKDDSFEFAFCEDVLEHFDQGDSLIFISEVYRTLRPHGILRLSFPGLEGVLKRHFHPWNEMVPFAGKIDAYSLWDHRHFYAFEEIRLVGTAIGFRKVTRVMYNVSEYAELTGLDTRPLQADLNCYVELQK